MRATRKLKIVSNNKVRANRENAKKSTGPRTLSGKEKVSGNALTHGLTAEVKLRKWRNGIRTGLRNQPRKG